MSLRFRCLGCGRSLKAASEQAGKRSRCPRCGNVLTIPNAASANGGSSAVSPAAAATSPEASLPGLPGFRILAEIGRGGMGVAYRAVDTRLDREVAVKVLGPECRRDAAMLTRFRRGCRAAARLEHPNIVAIRALELDHDPPFLVMELVLADDGNPCNLSQLIKRKSSQPVHETCVTVMSQLCEAMCFAHEQGMVHRDIKPSNVLVARTGLVKIADFELAYIVSGSPSDSDSSVLQSAELTRSGTAVGTLEYMSPEQRGGQTADARSDVYSLCAVAHFMLTGVSPVGFPPPIDVNDAGLSQAWTTLLRKGMAHDPSERFPSMRELSEALRELRAVDPPAHPISKPAAEDRADPDQGVYGFADDSSVPTVGRGTDSKLGVSTSTTSAAAAAGHTHSDDLGSQAVPAKQNDEKESRELSEKAANRLFGRSEEHRARLTEIREVRSHAISQKDLPELIARVNDWSNKKVAYIRNLGDGITITRAIRSDAVIADLDMLMLHRRLVYQAVDSRKAEGTTAEQAGQLVEHHLEQSGFPATKGFDKPKLDDQLIPGAVLTRSCDDCNGHGVLRCGACNGQGNGTCPKCGGSGQYTNESFIGGIIDGWAIGDLSRARQIEVEAARKVVNTGPCDNCGGSGVAQCGSCSGSGEHRCDTCGATGELLTQLSTRRRLWPQHFRVVATDSPMPPKLLADVKSDSLIYEGNIDVAAGHPPTDQGSGAIELNSADVRAGGRAVERKLTAEAAVPAPIAELMKSLIAGAESLGTGGPFVPKPIRLRLRVRRLLIDTVEFEYGGSHYVIHVAGSDRAVLDERVPSRGKAVFRGIGSLVKNMWQSGRPDPVEEAAKLGDRFTPKGTRVHVCDHDMRLITLLEERGLSVESSQRGYKIKVPVNGKRVAVSIRFDGWAVRMISMIAPASREHYRSMLRLNAQVLGGGVGVVDTTKGKWFCATRALVYDSSSANELTQALEEVIGLVGTVKSALA